MQQHEKAAFGQLVKDVMAYYRQDTSKFLLDTWWGACQSFDMEQIQTAMQRHATDAEHGRFAPKVADVVRILEGTHTDRSMIAWGKVFEAMSAVGAYQDILFDDAAIHASVQDAGGWPKLCRTEQKELGFVQTAFCKSHRAYMGRGKFDYPRVLAGDSGPDQAQRMAARGLPAPQPVLIGDPALCALVFEGGNAAGKTRITFQSLAALSAPSVLSQIETEGVQ